MATRRFIGMILLLLLAAGNGWCQGNVLPLPEDRPIRSEHFPALSPDGRSLCFSYLGDLWTVPASGGTASRLTVHEADDAYPSWSPDGHWIAFSSNRNGPAYDVYVIPAVGGEPKELTFHSATDIVNDWSPDGSKILFYSGRGARGFEIHALDLKTGIAKTLTHQETYLRYASYSPDGQSIAYTRMPGPIPYSRPHYHGSGNADIYIQQLDDGKSTRVTDYDGMDMWPMWAPDGRSLYYVTDQLNGTPNIVRVALRGGQPSGRPVLVTHHTGDAVRFPSMARDGSLMAYECNGDLWTVRPSGSTPTEVRIYARTEGKANATQRLSLTSGATEMEVSPDGKTLALGLRGEIWTVPADKGGDAARLTNNPANDHDFSWSPDNAKLAFVSDRDGPYHVYTVDVKTRAEKRMTEDPYDDTAPQWSPDGKTLAFLRSGPDGGIYAMPAGGGSATRVAESAGNNLFGVGITSYSWSPDGKWLGFARRDALDTRDIWVVPVGGPTAGAAVNLTRYPGENDGPRWTSDGKTLLFLSDRGPLNAPELYALPLQKPKDEDEPATMPMPMPMPMPVPKSNEPKKPIEVKIDFDDIQLRARRLSPGSDPVSAFAPTPDGKAAVFLRTAGGAPDYWIATVSGGSTTRLSSGGAGGAAPRFPAEGAKFYFLALGGGLRSMLRSGGAPAAITFTARMELDRHAELTEAFNQFWRAMNTGFYDPKMHAVDWRAVRAHYEPLLAYTSQKEDFAMLLSNMVGELNASHSEVGPAPGAAGVTTAQLGVEFDEDYPGPGLRITRVMPDGPADTEPHKLQAGEYILSIDGTDVKFNEEVWRTLEDKAGRTVELVVNSKPEKEGARTVKLKPINPIQLANLDYERRVRDDRKKVDELSGGKLAYIHIKGMDAPSLERFERELYGDAQQKQALVLDVRHNGGGSTHDKLLEPLSRIVYGYTQPRDAVRSTQPVRHWNKPIVLLTDQMSASDAEIFPYGFRALHLGKIVGMPTPGYVIGTYSGALVDGTTYRIPMWGWFTEGGQDMENHGIQPDVTVDNDPGQVAQGKDPQLETAVRVLLDSLPKK